MTIDFFRDNSLFDAANRLFQELAIRLNSNTSERLDYQAVLKHYAKDTVAFHSIEAVYFSGLIDDSVFAQLSVFNTGYNLSEALAEVDKTYEGLMLFSLELSKKPTRTEISELTRAFNRISQKMPVALLLKYEFKNAPHISIAISERFKYQQSWRQGEKTGKIIILRDIDTISPHSGHLRILNDLVKPNGVTTYAQLHQQWLNVLDVSVLNMQFFNDLANWYLYSQDYVKFPNDLKVDEEKHIQINLIRLITRLIFVWFLKEKGLIRESLFEPSSIKTWIKSFDRNGKASKNYYPGILQNLFFATLNQRMKERGFIVDGSFAENKDQYGVKTLYRYASLFKISQEEIKALFEDIPFLNGGLFDCLDKEDEETKKVIYVDGFSRNARKVPTVPDFLFFGDDFTVDLTEKYGYKKNKENFSGIIEIFKSYKFTIEENTPIEEEIALDPELLGKVFENLLAYYNPETETTARKQTGSFYTPREIVNYMVDESLIAYLKKEMLTVNPAYLEFGKAQTQLFANDGKKGQLSFVENLSKNKWTTQQDELGKELRRLIDYNNDEHGFSENEVQQLIFAIDHCKILDPACGSGAFPMGILHKLVYILSKLDPENKRWRGLQQKKAEIEIHKALSDKDKEQREKKLVEINDAFEHNSSDYGRKLYLIENCIYGVDIQSIAVQISKLRFFISLIVDQKERKNSDNRGIRPLPNLETKFVAANTLIGLEKPKQLGLEPTELEVLEGKLEQIRHGHFEAKTRKEKLQCQKEDKAVRKKIAELLKSTGWHKDDADKIARFDIYDQNLSAEWFDSKWMFGKDVVKFHIVIGNPPWGAKLTVEEKTLFKKTYKEIDSSTPNSFAYFIGWSLKNYSCFISLVLPDSILIKDYEKTRGLIKDEMSEILWYENAGLPEEYKPFVYVDHDVCVLNINKEKSKELSYKLIKYDRGARNVAAHAYRQEKSVIILPEFNNAFNLIAQAKDFKILQAIKRFDMLDEFLQCHEGIHSGNAREILFIRSKKNKYCHPLFYGGGAGDKIDNYYGCTSGWFVDYREDIIDKKNGFYASLRDERIFKYPKIYLTRTGNPFKAFLDEDKNYASNNFFSLQFKDYDENDTQELKYILPFIISKVAQYFIRTFAAPRLGSTFVETKIFHLLKFRVPKQHKAKKLLIGLVEIIIFLKQKGESSALFERLIDAIIYEIYFSEQLKFAGANVIEHLTDFPEIKEEWDSNQKSKAIEKVYKQLSNPKNAVAIALFKMDTIEEIRIVEGL